MEAASSINCVPVGGWVCMWVGVHACGWWWVFLCVCVWGGGGLA